MKFFIFALALLAAGASALPQNNQADIVNKEERLVTGTIRNIIREIQKAIQDNHMDPLIIKDMEYTYNIPFVFQFPGIPCFLLSFHIFVNVRLFIDDLTFVGASDIKINNLDYSVLFDRLRFDLELPLLALEVGNSGVEASILGGNYDVTFKGSSSISRIRLSGEVRVNIGIISGISIRSLSVQFSVGGISSAHELVVFGEDISDDFNNVFNNIIPDFLNTYQSEINQLLTDIIRGVADAILG
ncbi:uncharacterized protein LOC119829854 [Zerene cesonia]|uniref:uncharacterized protein LOC119829854 n=1 Tax=Zerene cesonia TaxID=33412 RepID=UPI0018E501B6|nr:uncharacterized protein LOC119829854 [Zerene cesonia]